MRNNDLTVRVNYYPYRDFGRKAEVFFMKKITRNICFIIFLLLPLMIHAEEQANYSSIVTDGVAAFVCTDDGRVFSCNNDQVDDTVPITVLDPEREHILIKDGQPVILQQDIQTLHILSVDRKPLVSVEMDSSLTWGTDDWSVRQPRILDNRLYFLFYVGVEENARLVRYDLNTKDYKVSQYSSVVAYQPLADGSAYMAVQGEDHTEIYQVFQEATLEQHLYNIDSVYTCLAWENEKLWAVHPGENAIVLLEEGKQIQKATYAYASSAWQGVCIQGRYLLLGSNGLVVPDTNLKEESLSIQKLRLYGSGFNDEIDNAFLAQHPNVIIERISSELTEGMDLLQAITAQVIQVDVLAVSNTTPGIDNFLQKGYAVDLSVHAGIRKKIDSMYPPIRSFVCENEHIYFLPTSVRLKETVVPISSTMEQADVFPEDIPNNYPDFLDWMTAWYTEQNIDDLMVVPLVLEDDPYKTFLYQAIKVYVRHYEKQNTLLTFDTEAFRTLLQKVRQAAQVTRIVSDTFEPRGLLLQEASMVPSPDSIALPYAANETPRYEGQLNGYIVCSSSNVQELAMEYIYFRTSYQTMTERFLLYDGDYEPIERDDYQTNLRMWQLKLQEQKKQLLASDNPSEQRDIQAEIDRLEERILNPDPELVYAVTEEEIQFYQHEIIPNIWYPYTNELVEQSQRNAWFRNLVEQFLNGHLEENMFVMQLEKRIRMMQMEGGII